MFGDRDEVTKGFAATKVSDTRLRKLEERSKFSEYPILPTKHSFPSTVRIYSYVLCFIKNARKGRKMLGELLKEADLWFSVFNSDMFLYVLYGTGECDRHGEQPARADQGPAALHYQEVGAPEHRQLEKVFSD